MSHTHTHTHVPPPPPPPSAAQVQVQDGPPDLDALAPSVYRTRHPLPARPRTALLRVPWPGAREQPAQQVGRGRPGLTVTRSGGVGRRSTDVRSGGDGLEEESEEESEDEGSWEGEREEKWLDPRFGWSGRVRGHKEAMPYPLSYGEEELN
ncbi:hypothetical protein CALVIDRAFT_160906 [Calocera viscosa TUFC12733]|uniref:Uncharacterized protein n=1 Tax=Calocera viscosa (strain TUFC12733) TaxID=1330018 RepID=A0A167LCT4_CALVF|nr:hypothetical protein CALVIDRAFT_160906 [Calocera viscosa TUFC12733]